MPSVKNPNGPSKNRLMARRASTLKKRQKASAAGQTKISKADQSRGAGGGLLPTSGPNAALSSKKRKKLEQRLKLALRRKMEAEGEIEMKDVPEEPSNAKSNRKTTEQGMDVDAETIS